MLHTPDGARVGLHCIWWGTAKDRKLIVKTLKEFLEKVPVCFSFKIIHFLFKGRHRRVRPCVTLRHD